MKKQFLKVLSLVLLVLMVVSIFAACDAKETDATKDAAVTTGGTEVSATTVSSVLEEFVKLRVLYPGDMSKRFEEFLNNEFKQRIKDDLNMEIEVSMSTWDQYWSKKDLEIAAGEQIDWYWDGGGNMASVLSKQAAVPIDDLVNTYGKDLLNVIPTENWKAFVVGGKQMAIPMQYAPTSEKFTSVLVRQEILEAVGMTDIKSMDDMDKFAEAALAKFPEMKFYAADPYLPLTKAYYEGNATFDAKNTILVDEDTKKAQIAVLTEGYKKAADKAYEWAQKGWLPEEVTIKPRENVNRMVAGNYIAQEGAISRPLEQINDLRKNVPTATLAEYMIASEKPKYKVLASTEAVFISPTAKYPERAMMMLNWMLKSKENYLFCIYGVEGKDYTIENNRIQTINTDSLWYEWMFRNLNYMQYPDTVTDKFIDIYKAWDTGAKISCHFAFVFDPDAVATEGAMIEQVTLEKFLPISTGFIKYEDAIEDGKAALIAAGVDKYLAEYQKQLDAFIASNQ